jgi:hypothetical protein
MDIFEKTPNDIVQHGPCPYCGEWACTCSAWACPDKHKDYTVDDLEAIRNHRISKETAERTKLLQEKEAVERSKFLQNLRTRKRT